MERHSRIDPSRRPPATSPSWRVAVTLVGVLAGTAALGQTPLSPLERLGESIFFDENLSLHGNQSCATCHDPASGWTGPDSTINERGSVYEGSVLGRFGARKPPSSAYATPSPVFNVRKADTRKPHKAEFAGGNFWDGRATGEKLGNPAADQAQGPFLNPVEQALPDFACVVHRVCDPLAPGDYPVDFETVWGAGACDIAWPADVEESCATEDTTVALEAPAHALAELAYDRIALAIAAYEGSAEVNAFTSKYDFHLAGLADLTSTEKRGLQLFRGKAKCARCHTVNTGPRGEPPLFTDFTYDNLGLPRNPDNPFYTQPEFNPAGREWIDEGLGGFLASRSDYSAFAAANDGKHKVPTLRNVDKRPADGFVKAFGHNGYFKSLEAIVHFYNTRDVKSVCSDPLTLAADAIEQDCWPEPEVAENVNTGELGDLGLSKADELAIVEFLGTLTDGYTP